MSLAAGERKKEMVQIECRWVVFQKVEAATENEQELWPRVWCLVFFDSRCIYTCNQWER